MLNISTYFPSLEEFRFKKLLKETNEEKPFWHALLSIQGFIHTLIQEQKKNVQSIASEELPKGLIPDGKGLLVTQEVHLKTALLSETENIFLEAGVTLEAGVVIGAYTIADKNSTFRQGAYLRGNVIIGKECVIGHTTELKNSIIMNHTEAGHFNYVGDSILGSYVNLGAGTKFANLPFRTTEEKKEGRKKSIPLLLNREVVDKSMTKLGVIAGDGVEFGCNSVSCPGVFLGVSSIVYPNVTIRKGFYPPQTRISATNLV